MGIDLGDVRVGIALSDEFRWTAQGLEVIKRESDEQVIRRIQELVDQYEVQDIVLGYPKNMNGTIGPRGERTREFSEALEQELHLPIHLWDERLSSVAAERVLLEADVSRKKRKQVIDKMAAQMILQGYLGSLR